MFAGCTRVKVELSGSKLGAQRSKEVKAALQVKAKPISSLRILATLELESLTTRAHFRQLWLASKPDRIRIDTLAPQGAFVLQSVLINSEDVLILNRTDKTRQHLDSAQRFFKSLLGAEIKAELFLPIVSAQLAPGFDQVLLNAASELVLSDANQQYYFIYDTNLVLKRFIVLDRFSRSERARVEYLEYQSEGFPARIKVSSTDFTLNLELGKPKFEPLSEGVFEE